MEGEKSKLMRLQIIDSVALILWKKRNEVRLYQCQVKPKKIENEACTSVIQESQSTTYAKDRHLSGGAPQFHAANGIAPLSCSSR